MSAVTVPTTGTTLEYTGFGDPADPALLLVIGYQTTQVGWDDHFCRLLAEGGRYVLRFDNRDIGRSSKATSAYTLRDLAADAVGLLDALGIESAHVLGSSMGGLIAQHIAAEFPDRVRTLTLLMSTTMEPDVMPDLAAVADRQSSLPEDPVDAYVATATWQGGRYTDPDYLREQGEIAVAYGLYPDSALRQLEALLSTPAPIDQLARLDIPTLVVHGGDDPVMPVAGSERLAELIPGSRLVVIPGMGHELPPPLWNELSEVILDHTS